MSCCCPSRSALLIKIATFHPGVVASLVSSCPLHRKASFRLHLGKLPGGLLIDNDFDKNDFG